MADSPSSSDGVLDIDDPDFMVKGRDLVREHMAGRVREATMEAFRYGPDRAGYDADLAPVAEHFRAIAEALVTSALGPGPWLPVAQAIENLLLSRNAALALLAGRKDTLPCPPNP